MSALRFGLLGCLMAVGVVHAENSRPNILLITSEDNGPELGCYGDPYVSTPHLDALASRGVRFANAYVTQAGCSQSRASILTGLYPHQNGQIGLATWKFRMYRDDMPNMVRTLKGLGYRTGIIGKLHINPASAFPFDTRQLPSSNFARKTLPAYAEHAAHFIQQSNKDPNRPFFLMVNYPDAHRPFLPQVENLPRRPLRAEEVQPLAYFGVDHPELRKQTADYYNCMSRLDSLIDELLQTLNKSGKTDNTLVIYLGDHGADMLRGKRTSYEGGLRIPLIISWPGMLRGGQVREEFVSTIDLLPTLLHAVQVAPPADLPGMSLLPLLQGEAPSWRSHLFTEYHLHSAHNFYPQRTVRNQRYKLIQSLMPGKNNPGYAFTMNRFFADLRESLHRAGSPVSDAYERMRRPPEFELYDLVSDPHEFTDLSGDAAHQHVLTELQRELTRWRQATNDPFLDPKNLTRLKAEIDASFVDGVPEKGKLKLDYPRYFFGDHQPAGSSSRVTGRRHNVLFIAVDDLRPALGCYGDPVAKTPNIDDLAARGMRFDRAYCQLAVCSPSRLSLLTGLRPDTIRVWDLKTHFRAARPNRVTLPQLFKQQGYHTRAIGKIYHGSGPPSKDGASWSEEPLYDYVREASLRYASAANLSGKGLKRASIESVDVPESSYVDGLVCDAALEALAKLKDRPFFLGVGFRKPHLPFCAPKKYWDLYELQDIPAPVSTHPPEAAPELATRSWRELEGYQDIPTDGRLSKDQVQVLRHGYYACVSYIDVLVGRLLAQLDELNLRDNTVVCLWGDHGYHLGEQGLWTKANNYELSTRAPLIFALPGQQKGVETDALVELVDMYPSLAEACGLPVPEELEGLSFLPLFEAPSRPWKTAAFSQFPRARQGNRHSGRGEFMGYAIRTPRYRYVEWRHWPSRAIEARELYDHRVDPQEMRNIAFEPAQSDVLAKLTMALNDGWQAALPQGVLP